MSVVAPNQRRLVWPISLALTAVSAIALVLYLPTRTTETTQPTETVAAPGVIQPSWRIRAFPAGGMGVPHLPKKARARVRAQQQPLAALVEDVYDALFLQPGRLPAAVRGRFAAGAGSTLLARKVGLPRDATDVHIRRREARVGISVRGANQAAARVEIAGKAKSSGRPIKFLHESTLWLERVRGSWKVIAFDLRQGPRR